MKRLAALLAVLMVAAACGGGGGGGGGDEDAGRAGADEIDAAACPVDALEAATGPVEVEFWHAMGGENGNVLNELVKAYNQSQDDVRVKAVFAGTYGESLDKYLTALRGGNVPDLVQLEETAIQLMIDSGSATPASACIEAASYDTSDFLQRVLDEFTVEGVMWPMPFNVSNPVLYFNKVAFDKAGLDAENPPSTLAELQDASRKIVESGAAKYAMSVEIQGWYVEQWYAKAGETVVDNDNGRSARATAATLEKPVGEEIFGWLRSMLDEDLALNVGRNPSGRDHFLAIASGDAAMTIGTSAALGGIYDVLEGNPGLASRVDIRIAPMPGSDEGGVVVGGASLWMINKSSDAEKAAVWDFVTWLDEPEQQARWHAGTGYIPIRTSAAELPEVTQLWADRPGFEVAFRQLTSSEAPPGGGGPVIGGYPGFRDALEEAIERVILQGVSAADALAGAQEKADAAIKAYNDRIG